MKKESKVIISAILSGLLILGMIFFPPRSLALEDPSPSLTSDSLDSASSSTKEDFSESNYFSADSSLSSKKDVKNSLFLAGNEVESKDSVKGLGFLAGNLIEASGTYEYGLFAGNSIKINGTIEKDLFVAGTAIEIEEDASISRDVFAAASIVNISTNLNGNVFVAGGRLVLENVIIDGNLEAAFDQIIIKGKSAVSGTFKHNEDAEISGLENLSYKEKETFSTPSVNVPIVTKLFNKAISLLGILILTFIALALCNKFALKLLKNFSAKNAFKDVLLGLGVLLLVPLAAVFTMITIIGFKVSLVALILYVLIIIFSAPVSGLVLGDLLAKNLFKKEKMSIYLKALIGISLIEFLSLIPFIGGFFSLASLLFGIGFLFTSLKPVKN